MNERELAREFGATNVKVCSPYHLQVTCSGVKHQVYQSRGRLKVQLSGKRSVTQHEHISGVIREIRQFNPEHTDLSEMEAALTAGSLMSFGRRSIPASEGCAVFVDAGWKAGIANIAVVEIRRTILGCTVSCNSYPVRTASSSAAEQLAIAEGLAFNCFANVYSDNQPAVDKARASGEARVKWIPRSKNGVADKAGNRRGKR